MLSDSPAFRSLALVGVAILSSAVGPSRAADAPVGSSGAVATDGVAAMTALHAAEARAATAEADLKRLRSVENGHKNAVRPVPCLGEVNFATGFTRNPIYDRSSTLVGLSAVADPTRPWASLAESGNAAHKMAAWISGERGAFANPKSDRPATAQQREDALDDLTDASAKMALGGMLVDGLAFSYAGSEYIRTACVNVGRGVTAVTAATGAIVQTAASMNTLYGWSAAAAVPIVLLDASGYERAAPIHLDAAQAASLIHLRYVNLFESVAGVAGQKLESSPDKSCAGRLIEISKAAWNLYQYKDQKISGTQQVAFDSSAAALLKTCQALYALQATLASRKQLAEHNKGLVASLMAQDALQLNYEVVRLDRETRPSAAAVPGIIASEPFRLVSNVVQGITTAGSTNAPPKTWSYVTPNITVKLAQIALPVLPNAPPAVDATVDKALQSLVAELPDADASVREATSKVVQAESDLATANNSLTSANRKLANAKKAAGTASDAAKIASLTAQAMSARAAIAKAKATQKAATEKLTAAQASKDGSDVKLVPLVRQLTNLSDYLQNQILVAAKDLNVATAADVDFQAWNGRTLLSINGGNLQPVTLSAPSPTTGKSTVVTPASAANSGGE